jgi:hypothetical protein
MIIVDRQKFLELPAGVVYQKFEPHCIDSEICVKGETIRGSLETSLGKGIDWFYSSISDSVDSDDSEIYIDTIVKAYEELKEFNYDYEIQGRDGLFEENEYFVVYSKMDIEKLFNFIKKVRDSYPNLTGVI